MSPRAEARATTLEQLFATKEIVVFCGSGGVGKTSVAAAAALGASVRLGGKTLVLTIDPARRLATALGLDGIGNEAHRIPSELLKAAGVDPRGELWAAMLDTKQSWDDLVLRYAKDDETAHKILENRLYHNITARFVQSHDYIAMERLFEIHASGEYDLIVIDTPPTRNAVDFLDAPARMSDFFGGRLLRWLTLPYRVGGKRSARDQHGQPALLPTRRPRAREQVPRGHRGVLPQLPVDVRRVRRARESVERLLHDRRTTFAVVTTLEAAPLHEAEHFCATLLERHFHLGALVLNKTLPDTLLDPEAAAAPPKFADQTGPLAEALSALPNPALADPARTTRVLRTVGESFANFSVVAMREAELRAELTRVPDVVVRVPASSTTSAMSTRSRRSATRCSTTRERTRARYHRRVSTLDDLARLRTRLGGADLVHLERLAAGWRPLADLSFADLVLLAPIAGEEGPPLRRARTGPAGDGPDELPARPRGHRRRRGRAPLLARCWRAASRSRPTRTRSAPRSASGCSASRFGAAAA